MGTRGTGRLALIPTFVVGVLLAAVALTSCGNGDAETSPALSAESSCGDFLDAADADRGRALRQLAAALEAPDAVTEQGATRVDYTCAQNPDGTLGDAVAALGTAADPAGETTATGPAADPDAQKAAENGVVAALGYSWDSFEADMAAAEAVSTPQHWQQAQQVWETLKKSAATTRTTVEVSVLASGVVTQDDQEGQYLLFLDRPTTNASQTKPVVYKDSVLVTVALQEDGAWLIDNVDTTGAAEMPADGPAAVAVEMVSRLSTLTAADLQPDGTVDEYAAAMKPLLTSSFYAAFLDETATTVPSLLETGYESSYEHVAAGISAADDATATVLVAGSKVPSHDGEEQAPEPVRLEVQLVNDDGDWRVDDFTTVSP